MEFKEYKKIQALHKEECDGILHGTCYLQEKVDGANASIWVEDGNIHCGSRTRDLIKAGDGFNGSNESKLSLIRGMACKTFYWVS